MTPILLKPDVAVPEGWRIVGRDDHATAILPDVGPFVMPNLFEDEPAPDSELIKSFIADWPDPNVALPAPIRKSKERLNKMDGEQAVRFYVAIPASQVAKVMEARELVGKAATLASTPAAARRLARQRKVTS